MRVTLAFVGLPLAALLAGACGSSEQAAAPPPVAAPPVAPPPPAWGGGQARPAPPSGAPCAPEGSYACAADRIGLLACRGGRHVVVSTCRGARRCSEGSAVACDSSVAVPGDPCDEPSSVACGLDQRTMLRCINGSFQPAETCRNACLSTSGRVLCQ